MGKLAYCLCLSLGLLCLPLKAQEIVLYTLHFPPHMIDASILPAQEDANKGQAVYGFDVDVVRAAYAAEGVTVHFKFMPWKRIMRDTQAGIILGAVSCRKLPSREEFAYFSDEVSVSINTLVTRQHFLDGKDPTLNLLRGYKTIAVNGWSQNNILEREGISYSKVSGLQQGFNVILHRDQDVFMTERDGAQFEAKRLGLLDQLSFYDIEGLKEQSYSVCLSKKYPDAKKWRDVLNAGLAKLKADGEWQIILKRYGVSE